MGSEFTAMMSWFSYIWSLISTFFGWTTEKSECGTEFVAETNLPTLSGKFRVRAYRINSLASNLMEPVAVIMGEVEGKSNVPLRVHDQCFTSEVLGSTKCDCREQLEYSMDYIRMNPPGLVIYLQQEGRGIGLANKIAAYSLQEIGYDTVEANRKLGFPDDTRNYQAVVDILNDLKIRSVKLMTNNPRKMEILKELGINIAGRIPVHIPPNDDNINYLRTKVKKMNHLITESFLDMHSS